MKKAVFIDRDGTLILDKNFLKDPDEVEFIEGGIDAVKLLNGLGFIIVIVSNQSGVARGYFTENEVQLVNLRVRELLENAGANVDAIYYCPHHPEGVVPEYAMHCDCRKPRPGMLYQAQENFDIDLENSYVIGDKESDVLLGKLVGACGIRVKTGYGSNLDTSKVISKADYIAENLMEAANWIKERESG